MQSTDNLEINYFDDGKAALFIGNNRQAIYQWIEPGYTQIALFETVESKEICYDGHCIQGEKAHDICWRWIVEGTTSINFRSYTKPA